MQDRRFRQWMIGIALLLVLALPLAYSAIVVPLPPLEQAEASLAMIALAVVASFSKPLRPLIIFLSCFASMRYFYWRVTATLNLDTPLDAVVCLVLLGAETYGLAILFLGYFQTVELLERTLAPVTRTPTVDVFIPTYNESVDIVRRTLIGALAIEYPHKRVYVLDDGRRPEIERMVTSLGGLYITRRDNKGAKAGNLNHALKLTDGELIAIFDADHVPVRSFLQKTVGFFEDPKVALVQSAQHFFNPDPYERNLNLTGKVAPEQHFFYHVIQPGNDFWNAAFFCGSCAVLRRSALESIGGIKTRTVTEDAHTALELHSRGWRSVYLPMALAAGLATETFATHVQQRIRWARGMAQILRVDCPLFKKGLSLPQRLNYFNAMAHFFFGIPRLILVVAPFTYLYLGAHPMKADALAVIAYILPHIGLSMIANSLISRRARHSFWAAVYEISIAPYVAGVTLLAMVNPKLGKFNVTDKGTHQDRAHFDFRNSRVTLALLAMASIGLLVAFPLRLLWFSYYGGAPSELDSLVLNSVWAMASFVVLVATACVGYEQPQQRNAPRIRREFACELDTGEKTIACKTIDLSESGMRVALRSPVPLPERCRVSISSDFGISVELTAVRVRYDWGQDHRAEAALAFENLDAGSHRKLVELIFTGENSWSAQAFPEDRMLTSFWHLLTTFWRTTKPRKCDAPQAPPLHGRWTASFAGQRCQCVTLSGDAASVVFDRGEEITGLAGEFRVQVAEGLSLAVSEAHARPVEGRPGHVELEFAWAGVWSGRPRPRRTPGPAVVGHAAVQGDCSTSTAVEDDVERQAFWDSLYQGEIGSRSQARKGTVWAWMEDLI